MCIRGGLGMGLWAWLDVYKGWVRGRFVGVVMVRLGFMRVHGRSSKCYFFGVRMYLYV